MRVAEVVGPDTLWQAGLHQRRPDDLLAELVPIDGIAVAGLEEELVPFDGGWRSSARWREHRREVGAQPLRDRDGSIAGLGLRWSLEAAW